MGLLVLINLTEQQGVKQSEECEEKEDTIAKKKY